MQSFDIVVIVIVVLATIHGVWRGLIWQVAALASIFVSFFVACQFSGIVADRIPLESPWNMFLGLVLIYAVTALIIWAFCQLLREFIERVKLKEFDRQMGGLLGFIKGLLFCGLITLVATTLLGEKTRETVLHSTSGRYIALAMTRSVPFLPDEIRDHLKPYLDSAFGGEDLDDPALPDILPDPDKTPEPDIEKTFEEAKEETRKLIESME